jgi:hypothetical protein
LFAAFLTAFLLFTITQLQPNNTDISKDILLHISLQLSNSSVLPYVEPEFIIPPNVAIVNILLFASLALVLAFAFLALLTRTWLQDFDRSWKSSNVPEERARKREMRIQGMERWKLDWVVALLPLLIQASLVLFQVALLILLFDLHRPTAYSTLVIFAAGVCFYFSTTIISTFDANAPFTSPLSRALQVLLRQFRSRWVPSIILSHLKWKLNVVEGAMVTLHPMATIHCAISTRLYTATSKAVENVPVFTEIFDQWVYTPSLWPQSVSDWRPILPLVLPYLFSAPSSNDLALLPVARLVLFSDSTGFFKEREAIIASLRPHSGDTRESPSIEQLYIHLLRLPGSDWSLAGQVVRKLNADRSIIIELRWILKYITFRYLFQSKGLPNDYRLSWVSNIRNIIPFLRSTALYIIQNRLINDDHGLFNSLLLITRAIAYASNGAGEFEHIHAGIFLEIEDLVVPWGHQWNLIRDLYTASSTSAAGFKHEFTQLVILLFIGLSTVDDSDIILEPPVIDPKMDLAVLMDALWETWQAPEINHHLLTGIAVWILEQTSGSFENPLPDGQQRRFQRLLNAYDSYTRGAVRLMNSNALLFIDAALSFSLKTGKALDGDSEWRPQTLELENPWLVMHIHNILGHNWRIPGSAMREAVQGQLEWCKDDRRDALDELDRLGALDALEWREGRERQERRERRWDQREEQRDWLEQWHKRCPEQSPTVLEIVARSQLKLYNDQVLRPDPVALGLFLSPAKKDIFNDSRRFILQFFGLTPSPLSFSPPNATEQDEVDPATARELSDFFGSKAIGDVTKWRLLTSVVFPAWETLSTQWKDLLATKVMKIDWLARVTPLLAGTFNLYEFGLSENDSTYGDLTPTHLHMVATVVEYLGAERLTYEKARRLEEFLGQYSNTSHSGDALSSDTSHGGDALSSNTSHDGDALRSNTSHGGDALRRIQLVITQVMQPDPLEFLVVLFGDQT